MSNNSVKVANFWIGTAIFVGLSIVTAIIMPIYVTYNTNDKSQIPTNRR